jgi:hypothetical protein
MKRAYRFCLILYPREHREQFAEEMKHVFGQAAEDRRAEGWTAYFRFAFSELAGLFAGAAWAWLAPERAAQAAAARYSHLPRELAEAQQRVDDHIAGMVDAIANHQFERARQLSDQERLARENLRTLREKYGDELGMSC